jgi:endonuclease/exonuclease/phosphatase (EEP) superfamily protein YafD
VPRWPLAVPLALLLVALALRHRRRATLLAVCAGVLLVLGPIAGGELPGLSYRPGSARSLRIMTANVATYSKSPDAALALAAELEVDIAVFQECSFQLPALPPAGWHVHRDYLLCVISRHPIVATDARDPREFWAVEGSGLMHRYEIDTPVGRVKVVNVHLETPRDALVALRDRRLRGIDDARRNLAGRDNESRVARAYAGDGSGYLIVAGDFNMVQASAIYRRHWDDLQNAFGAVGLGFGFTKYTRWHGSRIDHILLGPAWTPRRAFVARALGKDHRPVVADIELTAP